MKTTLIAILSFLVISTHAGSFEVPEIPGWEQDGDVMVFERDNLFDHINGAAEFYLSYDFQKLWVARYVKGDAEITLEVYDQGDPVHAYGIYSMERPPEIEVSEIGTEGYYEETILNFVAGKYYVKMNAYREPDAGGGVLLNTGGKVSDMLSNDPQLPDVVKAMPKENLEHNSRQFISNTFMGLDFLGSAYRGVYQTDKGKLTLFVMERSSKDEVKSLLKQYHEFAEAEYDALEEGEYVIEDPFNGTIELHWKGNYIIGFSGDDLKSFREELLGSMKTHLDI